MARRPEYVLKEDFAEMPAGSHVTPVRPCYINRETRKEIEFAANITLDLEHLVQHKAPYTPYGEKPAPTEFMVCFTARGYLLIPTRNLEQK
jgi:hypothetical protein